MSGDDYQIFIPPSFQALYLDARRRLTLPLAEYRLRYELCEDLAQILVEPSQALHHDQGVDEAMVLTRTERGLCMPDSGYGAAEARWVVTRLAELLGWPAPAQAQSSSP